MLFAAVSFLGEITNTFFIRTMMSLTSPENFSCDVLVIGGGGAGLRAAIEAKERGVDVISCFQIPGGIWE